jgi:YidC/Oxa1 family membrane protein insertase
MDKKNTIIGVALLAAAFGLMYLGPKPTPPSNAQPVQEVTKTGGFNQASNPPASATSPRDAAFAAVSSETTEAKTISLSNDFVEVRFTNYGGAIKEVALKKYDADKARKGEPYIINQLHADPSLGFVNLAGLDRNSPYELVSSSPHEIVFRAVFEKRVEVLRRYTLVPGSGDGANDAYQLRYETVFRNLTDQTIQLPRAEISVGTSAPLNADDYGQFLSNAYNGSDGTKFVKRSALEGGGFLSWFGFGSKNPLPFIETSTSIRWASVQNQFFVSIITPDQPGSSLVTRRVELPAFPGTNRSAIGVTGIARFDVPALPPKGEAKLSGQYYAGPKEYHRLSNGDIFKLSQDAVMDFGFFSFFSKILLTLMSWIHGIMPNATWAWGYAIVLTTLTLKFVFLPLNLSASKSAKRMQKIQPQLTAVREKYKDDPKKLQMETMDLFKKNRVNPMGGCLPVLITIPFFIGFFSMLQSTAELRFQDFLWAADLSAPDTVARFLSFPINIMPVLMGATMIIQMHITPQPTVDNMQAKMFKFMPYVFALFCYNFSCALSLYSTVNGIFTIGQQLVVNRMKDDPPAAPTVADKKSRWGRPVKNVTPKK